MLIQIDLDSLATVVGGDGTHTSFDLSLGGGARLVSAQGSTHFQHDESDYSHCVNAAVATHRDIRATCGLPPNAQRDPLPSPVPPSQPARRARPRPHR